MDLEEVSLDKPLSTNLYKENIDIIMEALAGYRIKISPYCKPGNDSLNNINSELSFLRRYFKDKLEKKSTSITLDGKYYGIIKFLLQEHLTSINVEISENISKNLPLSVNEGLEKKTDKIKEILSFPVIDKFDSAKMESFSGNKVSSKRKTLVFISYSTIDKKIAGLCKEVFENEGVSAFLAHEDIKPSEEWQETILKNLNDCDIFVAIVSKNFYESEWTNQEVGIALSRRIKVFPISIDGTNPQGFISKYQAAKFMLKNDAYSDETKEILRMLSKSWQGEH